MDKLARRVAARWALKEALGEWQPAIPDGLLPWVDGQIRLAYGREVPETVPEHGYLDTLFDPRKKKPKFEPSYAEHPDLHVTPKRDHRPGQDEFDEAKTSVEIMLPRVLKALQQKFGDRFYMNATQQRMKLYYYFSGHPALETFALTITMQGGQVLLWLGYIPTKVVGGSDFQKAMHESVRVREPDMAGLALMRLLRKLLDRID